jgi:hypothetical protein
MYKIIHISSGVVAASFLTRGNALDWLICNNFDEKGNELHMYALTRD